MVAEPPGSQATGRSPGAVVARNAAAAGLRYAVAAVLALWVTRYMLDVVGPAQFGVWALAGALVPLLRLADLGLGRALTRAVAEARGRGEPSAAASALGAARGMAIGVALAAVLAVWLVRGPLVAWAGIPARLVDVSLYVLLGSAFVVGLEMLFAPYQAALDGLGRLDLTSAVDTVQRLASALGVVLVLAAGWGLPGLVWKNLATALAAGLAYRALLARHGAALAAAPLGTDRAELRALLAFGRHVQAVNLAALTIEPVSKALLSRYIGLDAVTLWDLALRVCGQVSGAFLALVAALFPAAAEARARAAAAGDTSLRALYHRSARYVTWLALPVFGLLAALAGPFVLAWLGPAYAPVASAIAGLAGGWLVAVLTLPAFLLAQAGGHERLSTAAGLATAGVSLALMALWVPPFGLAGAVAGSALGLAAGGLVALGLFAGRLHLRPGELAILDGRAWLSAALVGLAAAALARLAPPSLAAVVGVGLLGLLAYAGLMVLLGAPTAEERGWLRDQWRALRTRRGPAGPAGLSGPPGGSGATPAIGRVIAVVPAWNAGERLGGVLAALAPQVAGVVVVDNGSADGTVASPAAGGGDGPPVDLIANAANRGYAAAVNQGVQRALDGGADALLLVNDDALFLPGAVSALAAALAGDGRLAAATAHMVYRDQPGVLNGAGGRVDRARGWAALRGAGEPDDGRYAGRPMVDYPSGAACLIRAEAWRAVGPLDEAWYLYYEDADWGLRAGELGWRCAYVPAARVVHVGSAGTAADPSRRRYYNVRNRLRFARRHCRRRGWLWAWGATLALLARQPVRALFPQRRRDAAAVAWGVWDHLRGRYGRSGRFG